MANRKKEDLKLFYNLNELDIALNNDFGGDVLIFANKEDLNILENSINIDKDYTFFNIQEIYLKNIEDILLESFGVILIFANHKDIIYLTNQIKNKDISSILIPKNFVNLYFLSIKPYAVFILDNYINKQDMILQKLFYDFSKIQNYIDEIIFFGCNEYKKLNINNINNYSLLNLSNELVFDYFNIKTNPLIYKFCKFENYDFVVIFYIWLTFTINDFEKLNILNQSNLLFLKTNFLNLKNNIDSLLLQNKNIINDFLKKYKKTYLLDFLLKLVQNYLSKQI